MSPSYQMLKCPFIVHESTQRLHTCMWLFGSWASYECVFNVLTCSLICGNFLIFHFVQLQQNKKPDTIIINWWLMIYDRCACAWTNKIAIAASHLCLIQNYESHESSSAATTAAASIAGNNLCAKHTTALNGHFKNPWLRSHCIKCVYIFIFLLSHCYP